MFKMLPSTLLVVVFAAISNAAPASSNIRYVVHEERSSASRDWVKRDRIEGSAVLPMRIGLTQTNLEIGHDLLMDVSDPTSSRFGQWWTADEVRDMFAPKQESVDSVKDWLTSSGIHPSRIMTYENKGWLAFDATVEEAESLLLTEFYEHEHTSSSKVRVGCDRYHVPEDVSSHIDYITPGVKLAPVVKRKVERKTKQAMKKRGATNPFTAGRCTVEENPFLDLFEYGFKPLAALLLPEDVQDCGRNVTPACYRALYGIPQPTTAVDGHSLGLYEQGDYFAKEDIDLFFAKYASYVPQGTYPIPAMINGASYGVAPNSSNNMGESDIDIDIAQALIYPQTITLYQVDDDIYEPEEVDTTNLFNTFLDALDGSYCNYTAYGETGDNPSIDPVYPHNVTGGYNGTRMCGTYKPTWVISASYGQAEADLPVNYTKRQCNEFMKLGLQGHSILAASGDYGVASFTGDGDSIKGCLGTNGTVFNPQYPGNCPYVTSVGATMLYPNDTVLDAESVMRVNLTHAPYFASAGGFSNYFGQPSYQQKAVATYFADHDPGYAYYSELEADVTAVSGLYNRIGRGYPDVSANGANMRAFNDLENYFFYGSSLSSPLFASVLTLINQERSKLGKGTVGFVNPTLYAYPSVLNDITNGTTAGCGTEGFKAVKGWDPATGLGTPNYPKMLALWLALP